MLDIRTFLYDNCTMKSRTVNEFIKAVRKLGRRTNTPVSVDYSAGKGSHGRIHYGPRRTTIKARGKTLGTGLQRKMLNDLGIDPDQLT